MSCIQLYVAKDPSPFLKMANQEGLVAVRTDSLPLHGVRFERNSCACSGRLGVHGRTIASKDVAIGFSCYGLPADCTHDEELTVVAWLTRDRFLSFGFAVEEYKKPNVNDEQTNVNDEQTNVNDDQANVDPTKPQKPKNFNRFLTPNKLFKRVSHPTCPSCDMYVMVKEPVFFLKEIVLSAENKGPTLESVLDG